jgi:predicted MFS family arabinose efflux permease
MLDSSIWKVGLAVSLAMITATTIPYAIAVLAPLLVRELGLTTTEIGFFGSLTLLVATASTSRAGALVDRIGTRAMMAVLYVAYAVALMVLASANSLAGLLVGAVAAGLSMSVSNPVTNLTVTTRVKPERWGIVIGTKQAGGQLSNVLAGLALPTIAAAWGWRIALVSFCVLAPIGLLSALSLGPDTSRSGAQRAAVAPPVMTGTTRRAIRRLKFFGLATGSGMGAFLYFLPIYIVQEFAVTPSYAGAITATGAAVGTVARLLWGPAAGAFRSPQIALVLIAWSAATAMGLLALAGHIGIGLVWVAVVLLGASGLAFITPAMLAVLHLAGPESTGVESGRFMRSVYAGGVMSPLLFGWIIDLTSSYASAWGTSAVILALAAAVVTQRADSP